MIRGRNYPALTGGSSGLSVDLSSRAALAVAAAVGRQLLGVLKVALIVHTNRVHPQCERGTSHLFRHEDSQIQSIEVSAT